MNLARMRGTVVVTRRSAKAMQSPAPGVEGITRARTFTRERRCTLVDCFRIT